MPCLLTRANSKWAMDLFGPLHSLFTSLNLTGGARRSMESVLYSLLNLDTNPRPVLIIDLSSSALGTAIDSDSPAAILESTPIKARLLREICSVVTRVAEQRFTENRSLNTMVVFDEAQRFAAEAPEAEESKALADRLVDYVRDHQKIRPWLDVHNPRGSLAEARDIRTTKGAKLRLRSHFGNRATTASGDNWRPGIPGTLSILRRPSGHSAIPVSIHAHGAGVTPFIYRCSGLSLGIHGFREVSG